ncbi:MAG: urea carboxylase-associated family protein [Gammaproteobacteria bacterium]|nr:urea carboxylase-associated family protein [Gammaproteobacteria bacterium]
MNTSSDDMISSATVQPHHGASGLLKKGQRLRIVDLQGQQVTDFVAVAQGDPLEYQDMIYSNLENARYQWQIGDVILSSRCNTMWTITDDTRPNHYTGGGACCREALVHAFGAGEYGCRETIQREYEKHGFDPNLYQQASILNINMTVTYAPTGEWTFEEPISTAGDYLELRAEMDLVWMASVCNWPEIVNGAKPTPVRFDTLDA